MKQKLQKIVVGLCVLAGALGLAACGHEHAYAETVTAPTCTTQGYTTYTCDCGESYVGAYVEELGHEFKQYVSDGNATCEADGTKTAVCARSGCKETDTVTVENSALGHEFKYYFSDNNATFEQNATKSAVCNHTGCKEIDTVEEPNTMLDASLYFVTDGGTITGTTQYAMLNLKNCVIPSKINGVEITAIGDMAFYDCVFLTNLIIPEGITTIGTSLFYNCLLTTINIPDSVTSIASRAFSNAVDLRSITVGENNTVYQSIDGVLYSKDGKMLIQYPARKTEKTFAIPNGVTSIESKAFENCSSLTSITIPNSVTNIGDRAFPYCDGLTSVEIPDSVTSIGERAFQDCYGLTSVVIGDGVTSIGSYAFSGCSSLTSVVIGDSVTSIGDGAFDTCDSLTSVVIGDSVTSIGDGAFQDCYGLTSVVIGDGVTSIGEYAFSDCYRLVEVVNHSTHITVEKGLGGNGYVGRYALAVYNVGDTFTGTKLSNDNGYIIYTDGEEKILVGYTGTETELILPTYVTKINQYAFYGRGSLTSVVIGDGVTSIGEWAFGTCDSLTSVVIPDSVTSIGEHAFYYCSSLTSVYYQGTAEEWAEISIGYSNDKLKSATRYYYSETQPTETGNYWHYDKDGNVVVW